MFDLKEALRLLPDNPGVYLMKDSAGQVIYVGKAKVLKNRVRQYFMNSQNHTPKVRAMVSHIASFETIVTDNEVEALVLESNLIKRYMPYYNILLKDGKHYPFIKITTDEAFPRLLVARKNQKDGALYFGPYSSSGALRETMELLQDLFKLRRCKRVLPRDIGKERPCLYAHIGKCLSPCDGSVSEADYKKAVDQICRFLNGKEGQLVESLQKEMEEASKELRFEEAAVLRDRIHSIETVLEKQKVISSGMQDFDIVGAWNEQGMACVQVFFVRSGRLIGREHYFLEVLEESVQGEILSAFIKQFYGERENLPKEIVVTEPLEEQEGLEAFLSHLRGSGVHLHLAQRGEKKALAELVLKNAREALSIHLQKKEQDQHFRSRALVELKTILMLQKLPKRIEAYDISNIGGEDSVGGMVVFEDAKPVTAKYRKFKIKWIEGADDYQSMQEVVYRRLMRAKDEEQAISEGTLRREDAKFLPLPDLMLIDGGRGHVSAVCEVTEVHAPQVPVFGMVKDDHHRTRDLVSAYAFLGLSEKKDAFRLVTQIQDEVHRTAVGYHKKLRGKKVTRSVLDEIPGIGPRRKLALLTAFPSVEDIKAASVEALAAVEGMNETAARAVLEYFREKN